MVVLYKLESSFHNEYRVNSQQFLLFYFVIIAGLTVYFLSARSKSKQRTLLDLSKIENHADSTEKGASSVAQPDDKAFEKAKSVTPAVESVRAKKEIVYFAYNGHEWEAHEVLGLESGVSLSEATQHYQNLIRKSDPSTFEFYDAAFAAILKLKRNQW